MHRAFWTCIALACFAAACVETPPELPAVATRDRPLSYAVGGGITLNYIPSPKPAKIPPIVFGHASVDKEWLSVAAYKEKDGRNYIYRRTGTVWKQYQKLSSSKGWNPKYSPRQFASGMIQGNDLLVSAVQEGAWHGAVYYFHYSGSQWVEKQILQASDKAYHDRLGYGSAMQGNTAVFGTNGYRKYPLKSKAGAAYVFVRSGTKWTQQQKLACPAPCGNASDFSLSMSLSGNTLLVGARGHAGAAGTGTGAAHIFVRKGTTWNLQQILSPKTLKKGDRFGYAGSVDGNTAVVGAIDDDTWGTSAGAAYIFDRAGTTWTQTAKVLPCDLKKDYWFGHEILLRGNVLFIGVWADSSPGSGTGSVYVYHRSGSSWIRQFKMRPPKGSREFSQTLSLDGKTLAVGSAGAAFVGPWSFTPSDAGPTEAGICCLPPDKGVPDLGPDASLPDLSPDSASPDASLPDLAPDSASPDVSIVDADITQDSAPTVDGGEEGCSCTLGRSRAPVGFWILLLLALRFFRP